MSELKFEKSILFNDSESQKHFLFRVINFGKTKDELKFMFNSPQNPTYISYSESAENYPNDTLMRSYGELSYHNDGLLVFKYPNDKFEETVYHNPHGSGNRRTPINLIKEWEPIFHFKILRYQSCKIQIPNGDDIILYNNNIFNGEAFEYLVYLGYNKYLNPPNNGINEMLYRVLNVADQIDLMIWLFKTNYKGITFIMNGKYCINDNNIMNIVWNKNNTNE